MSHQCGSICFLLIMKNSKHYKTARPHSQKVLYLRSKTGFLPFKINNGYITIK